MPAAQTPPGSASKLQTVELAAGICVRDKNVRRRGGDEGEVGFPGRQVGAGFEETGHAEGQIDQAQPVAIGKATGFLHGLIM